MRNKLLLAFLLLAPWSLVFQGLDVGDCGWSASNYQMFFGHHQDIKSSCSVTWLTNLIGALVDQLGLGLLGFRVAWVLGCYLTLWAVYLLIRDLKPLAASVLFLMVGYNATCWLNYNTLSVPLFALDALCLARGLQRQDRRLLFLAGALTVLNGFARAPNILALAQVLVIPLFGRAKDALAYLAGALLAGLACLGAMLGLHQLGYYWDNLLLLLGKGQTGTSHHSLPVLAWLAARDNVLAVLSAPLLYWLLRRDRLWLPVGLALALLYPVEDSWRWLVPGIVYFVLLKAVVRQEKPPHQQALALAAVLFALVAPVGSGLGNKNVVHGLWVGLPLAMLWLESRALMLSLLLYGLYLVPTVTFRNGPRWLLTTPFHGILTTPERAHALSEMEAALKREVKPGDTALIFVKLPILHYLTETRPYLYSSVPQWYLSPENLEAAVAEAEHERPDLPVVVRCKVYTQDEAWPRVLEPLDPDDRYWQICDAFVRRHPYRKVWEDESVEILVPVRGESSS